MKTLLLLRHAKSDWSDEAKSDHDRSLNSRGKRDAPRIGRLLQSQQLVPDLILSSTAKRARKTAQKVVTGGRLEAPVEELKTLYLAPPATYVEVIQRQDDALQCILVVGHNPGIEELTQLLARQPVTFATGTLAQMELDVARWRDLSLATPAALRNLWNPRDLDD